MLKVSLTSILSAVIGGLILFIGTSISPSASLTSSAQPQPAAPQIIRNTLLETTVDVEGGLYHMTVAELNLDPRAETALHIHPGPSVGYVENGRLQITVQQT